MARAFGTIDVEVKGTMKTVAVLSAIGSFLVSLALSIAIVGATYCLVIEVRHVHRSFIHAD